MDVKYTIHLYKQNLPNSMFLERKKKEKKKESSKQMKVFSYGRKWAFAHPPKKNQAFCPISQTN